LNLRIDARYPPMSVTTRIHQGNPGESSLLLRRSYSARSA
jgi:hypothetical protein